MLYEVITGRRVVDLVLPRQSELELVHARCGAQGGRRPSASARLPREPIDGALHSRQTCADGPRPRLERGIRLGLLRRDERVV